MSAEPPMRPTLPAFGADGEPCPGCGAPLAADQRYCLECGRRRGEGRLDAVAMARRRATHPRTVIHASPPPRRSTPLGSPRLAAGLCLAMLTGGMALGVAAGPDASSTFAAGGRRVIAIVQPSPAPAPAPVVAAVKPPANDPSSSSTSSADSGTTADSTVATDPVAVEPAAVDPVAPAPATDPPATDTAPDAGTPETGVASKLPPVKHVWIISLTGQRFEEAWGPAAVEPIFAELRKAGTLLPRTFAVARGPVAGGVALLSGQAPNPATQAGCATPTALDPGTIDPDDKLGQASGTGCLYPATVQTLPDQLTGAGLTWKAYVESIADPNPDGQQTCRHPEAGQPDQNTAAKPGDAYITARDPFVFFATIAGDPVCGSNVVGLDRLAPDLAEVDGTPNVNFVIPDACHDGRPTPCADGAPAGLAATGPWLKSVVDQITATDAYKHAGLILVTTDSTPGDGPLADSRACGCAPKAWPNTTDAGAPGPAGGGGGRVGTLLLSPFVKPGGTVNVDYDQISLLKSVEDLFGLAHLGAAADAAHTPFGPGVYAAYAPPASR